MAKLFDLEAEGYFYSRLQNPTCEGGLQLFLGAVRSHEGELHPHPLHRDGEEVISAAVDGAGGHHVVPAGGDVKYGVEAESHLRPRGEKNRGAGGRHGGHAYLLRPGGQLLRRI